MEAILLIFVIPLAVAAIAFKVLQWTISWKEFLLQEFLQVVLIGGLFLVARWGSLQDVENWNGRITAKDKGIEGCCHCHTVCDRRDSKGNCTSSHQECDHIHDYWWSVDVSTGDEIEDGCHGSSFTPNWWANAFIGEAASVEHSYQNYLKADPDSLWVHRTAHKKFLDDVPASIPLVHDKYHADKLILRGAWVPPSWAKDLKEINADLGRMRQVDLLVYVTKEADPTYADAIEEKWLYGPKNALIVVMGVPTGNTIAWARVVTISKVEALKISIRDTLQGKSVTDPTILPFLRDALKEKFRRTPMEEFSYLASAAAPQGWWLFLFYLGSFLISGGLTAWMHHKDVFGDERYQLHGGAGGPRW